MGKVINSFQEIDAHEKCQDCDSTTEVSTIFISLPIIMTRLGFGESEFRRVCSVCKEKYPLS